VGFGAGGGLGFVFLWGVLFRCGLLFWFKETMNAMEFEEPKPRINADERRLNALSEEITGAAYLSLFKY